LSLLILFGVSIEGIRLAMIPLVLSFIVTLALYRDEVLTDFATIQVGTLISLVLRYFFGEANFEHLKTSGPYDVGFTEFYTSKYSNSCSAFYPCNKN
jgi:hypothetical protein